MVDASDLAGLDPFAILDEECDRMAAFFESLDDAGWQPNTRCEGWTRREIVAHVAGVEIYHTACLDDRVKELFAEAKAAGAEGGDGFNAWMIAERASMSAGDVLAEWKDRCAMVRRRMRDLGADADMPTSVGPYPVGWMAFHICSEYATHVDDMDVPLTDAEKALRTEWREKVSRFALKETEKPLTVTTGDPVTVTLDGQTFELSRYDFVEAVTARLPQGHAIPDDFRAALRALA